MNNCEFPAEQVRLIDPALLTEASWTGWAMPAYFSVIPNDSAQVNYHLEFGCGEKVSLGLGDLNFVTWIALTHHAQGVTS